MKFNFCTKSVLMVDDDRAIKILMANILKTLRFRECHMADDGQQAFELFKTNSPDFVITDWEMGEHDGITLTKAIREYDKKHKRMTSIILCSGHRDIKTVKAALDAGVNEYLVKPFSINDIAKRINYMMTKPRALIDVEGFYGPDRRRRTDPEFKGPCRRKGSQV